MTPITKRNFKMKKLSYSGLLFALLFLIPFTAQAATYNFTQYSANGNVDVSSQLSVDIIDNGTNGALFTFFNDVGIASSITQVVFGDATPIFSNIAYEDSVVGVNFSDSVTNNGNDYGFAKTFISSTDKGTKDGVNAAGEWISYTGIYDTNQDYSTLLAAILANNFNIGLHLQSIIQLDGISDKSEKYVMNDQPGPGGFGNPVPLPAALWLFGPALLGFMGLRKKVKS